MRAFLLVMVSVVAWTSGALGARRGPAGETPRATDLLRAERLAEEVEARRRLPLPGHRSTWRHGGDGFGSGRDAPPARPSDVIINVRPPTRPRRSEP